MNRDDPNAIKQRISEVQRVAHELAELLTRAQQQQSQAGQSSGGPNVAEGEVVDAEPIEK